MVLHGDVLSDLGVEQRLTASTRAQIDHDQRLVALDANLFGLPLFLIRPATDHGLGRDRVGLDLAADATNQRPVGSRKGLDHDIPLAVHASRIHPTIRIGDQRSAGHRSGGDGRADAARRFLHEQVDVGVAAPTDLENQIPHHGGRDVGLEGRGLFGLAGLREGVDRGLRQPGRPGDDHLLGCRPLVGQHAGACPAQGSRVAGSLGEGHGQRVGFAIGRIDPRHAAAHPQGLPVGPEPRQVVGELQQLRRTGCEIGTRQECSLHLTARPAGGLEGQRERLIHPRLRAAACDRRRDEFRGSVEIARRPEVSGRRPHLGESIGCFTTHRFIGRTAGGCLVAGKVFGDRRTKVVRLDDVRRQPVTTFSGGGGGGIVVAIRLGAAGQPRLRVGDLEVTARAVEAGQPRLNDGIHQASQARLGDRAIVQPLGRGRSHGDVGRTQPRRCLGGHPAAKHEPARVVGAIHLAGDPAEHAATATHAAAHAAHATTHATTHPTHAAVDAARPAHAAAHLEWIDAGTRVHGQHEVGDRIDLHDEVFLSLLLRGDEQHLVLDEIGEAGFAQQQPERRPQRDALKFLGDRGGVEVDAGVGERLHVRNDGNIELVLQLADHGPQRSLLEVEGAGHLPLQRVVDPLLVGRRIGEIDRLVFLAEPTDLPPALGRRIDDRRLVGEWNRGHVHEVERVHEAPFLIPLRADVFRVVIPDPGLDERLAGHRAGGDRHRMIGKQLGRLLHELLAGEALGFGEDGRGRVGALDPVGELSGVVAEHGGVAFGAVVADPDALLDERVVALGELLDAILPAAELVVQPHPLAADRGAALGREVAIDLLPGAHDRLANPHLQLPQESLLVGRVEIVGLGDEHLRLLEQVTGSVRIGGEQVAGLTDPHGRLAFELLPADPPHGLEFREFAGVDGRLDPGKRLGRWLAGGSVGLAVQRHLADHGRFRVVRIAAEGSLRETAGRLGRPRRFRLAGHRREGGGFSANDVPGQQQPLPAEQRQEDAVGVTGVACEFGDEGVVVAGLGDRHIDGRRPRMTRRVVQRAREAEAVSIALHEDDRVAIGPQGRKPGRQHAERCVAGGRECDVLRPQHGLHGLRTEGAARHLRTVVLAGHGEHAAAGAGKGRQARPIHLRAHATAGYGHPPGTHEIDQAREFLAIDAPEGRTVTDVDDGFRAGTVAEQCGTRLDRLRQLGRPEWRLRVECPAGGLDRGRCRRMKPVDDRRAGHVHGGDREPVLGPGRLDDAGHRIEGALPKRARLAGRRVHENDDVRGGRRLLADHRETDGRHGHVARSLAGWAGIDERHLRGRVGGSADTGWKHEGHGGCGEQQRTEKRHRGDTPGARFRSGRQPLLQSIFRRVLSRQRRILRNFGRFRGLGRHRRARDRVGNPSWMTPSRARILHGRPSGNGPASSSEPSPSSTARHAATRLRFREPSCTAAGAGLGPGGHGRAA